MRGILHVTYATLILVSMTGGVAGEPSCIRSEDILSSHSNDGKNMIFRMRNGQVLVNHMHGNCPDLRFNGFSWVLRGGDDQICENQQTLRVLQSGEICTLGKFGPPAPSKQSH